MEQGSTVPRRQLGRYLKEARERADITVRAAAAALDWSTPRLWRVETGQVAVRASDVDSACRLYGVNEELSDALQALARETKARGWWHSYGDAVPDWFSLFVGLEAAASRLRQYGTALVPGLLQTRAYMYEVIGLDHPGMDADDRYKRVAVKLERQALLSRALPPAPTLDVILSESVLRRPVPDRAVMAEQLRHMVVAGERFNVSVRILPFDAGLHRGSVVGSFAILDYPQSTPHPEPSTVYIEGATGALYHDRPAEIEAYEAIWASVANLALSEAESRVMIAAAAEDWESR
ncbi:helix-turn-helix domain-containing protein [Phytohabitans suffuscus]|uniref:Transcriptional regulator n=1 Tax=Phytohabitans suffuscus TaxID=624315 RepID=A0A6F8YHX1_9ACTN|nr:helix-turn-helix transcriptional regulator [Phytohabitans suffuscus]BCB85734.1 transcriptional regulator [Phytohabitans suffuscus]